MKLRSNLHVMFICVHHLAVDAQSYMILLDEFIKLYEAFRKGQPSPLEPLSVQYAEYAHWQRRMFPEEEIAKRVAYWNDLLAQKPAPFNLSPNKGSIEDGAKPSNFMVREITPDMTNRLKEMARQTETTLYMALLTAFAVLLKKRSGCDDIIIGSPTNQRNHSVTESLIGYLSGMSVLRIDLSGLTRFNDVLKQVKEVVIEAMKNQDLTLMQLRDRLTQEGTSVVRRPYRVVLNSLPITSDTIQLPNLTITPKSVQRKVMVMDLAFNIEEQLNAEGEKFIKGFWRYRTDILDDTTMADMIEEFQSLLIKMADDPTTQF